MPRHFAEHVPCVLWARAEHAYCTCRARADASRPWFATALQSRATRSPSHRNTPSRPWCPAAPPSGPLGGMPAAASATAMGSAAQATPARHLPLGAAGAYLLARRLAPVASTSPCKLQRGGSPASSPTAAEPTSSRYKRRSPNSPEHAGNPRPPQWHSPSSHSTREGLLPHLRQLLPPPPPRPIRHL